MSYGTSKQWTEEKRETVNKFYNVSKSIHIKGNYFEWMPVLNKLLLFWCFYKDHKEKKKKKPEMTEKWKHWMSLLNHFF